MVPKIMKPRVTVASAAVTFTLPVALTKAGTKPSRFRVRMKKKKVHSSGVSFLPSASPMLGTAIWSRTNTTNSSSTLCRPVGTAALRL